MNGTNICNCERFDFCGDIIGSTFDFEFCSNKTANVFERQCNEIVSARDFNVTTHLQHNADAELQECEHFRNEIRVSCRHELMRRPHAVVTAVVFVVEADVDRESAELTFAIRSVFIKSTQIE